jgi:hypothetical protein
MKKITGILICIMMLSFSASAFVPQQKDTSKLRREIREAADTVSTKTKRVTKKGVAKIVDKTYVDKVGPQGQTIYINKHAKYYYIDKEGRKVYVTRDQLKDKPSDR